MASAVFTVQGFIHALEQGRLAQVLRWAGTGSNRWPRAAYLLIEFRGLSTSVGMRQAQIAREIARGNGFSTKEITPAAAELLRQYRGKFPIGNIPELTEAPLNPIVEAGLMYLLPQVLVFNGHYHRRVQRMGLADHGWKDATSDFPFQSVLGIANNQCLLYIDPTRWNPNK